MTLCVLARQVCGDAGFRKIEGKVRHEPPSEGREAGFGQRPRIKSNVDPWATGQRRTRRSFCMKLDQVRRIAMSLPSVTEQPHFTYTSFRVGGKIFATAPPEGEHLHVFVEEEQRQLAMALEPEPLEILTWGKRVVGLRVILRKAKPSLVKKLLEQSWSRKAPKRLLASRHSGPHRAKE
jgi:hypothetical protein